MPLILDTECYPNYWLASFLDPATNTVTNIEARGSESCLTERQRTQLKHLLKTHLTIGFNSNRYDLPMLVYALKGRTVAELKAFSDAVITDDGPPWETLRRYDVRVPRAEAWDHIDLVNVAPGAFTSLKMYAARMNAHSIEDLPYAPDHRLTGRQASHVRDYCRGDLLNTFDLYTMLGQQLDLRAILSDTYGQDLRSQGDPGIAQRVIVAEVERRGGTPTKPKKPPSEFHLRDPGIKFMSIELHARLCSLLNKPFRMSPKGQPKLPEGVDTKVTIGGTTYKLGIGGLHSTETKRTLRETTTHALIDFDVASYYPAIILQQGIYPEAIGPEFLPVYRSIVERRLKAKAAGDTVAAQSLKIVVNSAFGKLGNRYSPLYAPELLAQVTMTGQLSLLMLIERIEAAGIAVVSANTDGIVCHVERTRIDDLYAITEEWEFETGFTLEETRYRTLAQRDVNSYIAVKTTGQVKRKGAFAETGLMKNPAFPIIAEAVVNRVVHDVPLADTITDCEDLALFLTARRVTGGAKHNDQPLGRTVRWYWSTEADPTEPIRYVKNDNSVALSQGGCPLMKMPDTFPADVDLGRYVEAATKALADVGWNDGE